RDFHVTGVQTCALPISLSLSRMAWTAFSVVSQSMQASVMETPYLRSHRFLGMLWLPQPRWLSTIRPMIELLPSTIWLVTFSMTKIGRASCREGGDGVGE